MGDEKADFKQLKREIISLKSQLKQVNEDKEKWFKQKEDLKKEIAALIEKVKALKKEGDVSSIEAEKLKKERENYNNQVRGLIERIKLLHQERKKLLEKHGIKEDPEKIKKDIEKMEERIETEALSIDKEKKLMDHIRKMKKAYQELGGIKIVNDKIEGISKEIEDTKNKANEAHEKLKKVLKEKKSWYKEFFDLSKQINVIKKQQEKAFEMFIIFKNSFIDVSRQLSVKLHLIKKVGDENKEQKEIHEKRKVEQQQETLDKRAQIVEEKLKRGEKLSTEDLIALQGRKEEEED